MTTRDIVLVALFAAIIVVLGLLSGLMYLVIARIEAAMAKRYA